MLLNRLTSKSALSSSCEKDADESTELVKEQQQQLLRKDNATKNDAGGASWLSPIVGNLDLSNTSRGSL
jgi:hypothetical protein